MLPSTTQHPTGQGFCSKLRQKKDRFNCDFVLCEADLQKNSHFVLFRVIS
jgi:hypothetical protein